MYRDKAARRGPVTLPLADGAADFIATEIFDPKAPVRRTAPLPQTLA